MWCAGCAAPVFVPSNLQPETVAGGVAVRLVPADTVDRMDHFGGLLGTTLKTGPILAAVFTAGAPTKGELEIVSTKGETAISDLGFTGLYTYTIAAVLRVDGGAKFPVTATGTERAHGVQPPHVYAQRACERAAVELAAQLEALLR